MTPLEEARAFQAEATKGGNRQKGRPSARGRGRGGRDRGDSPHTPSVRGGRGGGGRGGSLLQRATSRAAHQPAPFEQEQSGRHLPSTPSYTPQNTKSRPFAIPIVAPPSDNGEFTPSASPSGIGSSMFAPQATPKATALASGLSKSQTPVTRGSTSIEESRHAAGAMTPQRQLTLHGGRGRGGGLRMSRFASQKEDDAVFAFFNDDSPAPVGEVRYYQEEYEEKKKTSELQKPSLSKLQDGAPKQCTEVPSAATSRPQGEPSITVDNKADHEANPNTEPATSTTSSSTASTAKPVASLASTLAKALAHPTSSKSGTKNRESLHVNGDNNKTDHKANMKKEADVQTEAEAEKARGKGEAEITPHDKYSSSVGVLGCKIDINRKAQAKQKEEANPKEEVKAEIKAIDEVDVKVSDKPAPVDSKTVNAQELEHAALLREREEREQQLLREREEREKQLLREREEREQQLLREIEEEEAALAEMAKLIAIKKANAEKLKKDKAAKLYVNSASGDAPGVLQQVTNTGSSLHGPHQGASAAVSITPSTANFGGAQSAIPALTENSTVTVNEGGFNNQTSVPHSTGGTVPNAASNSTDDLMDVDFEPATMQYVPHSTQISPLGSSNGHSSFQNGFQEAEEEEEL
ncbi:hypothetical protein B0H65DRAFT_578553 [Neurospora tetraspora]|uniref:Uncharacterized protein n=1 Tax=Neurospora tetraspora TaxID=94610 RepID=A0AAE0MQC9_9PEZI|nr:hypothetical protein B0H65DRAFT_578553 [Neurospora tetraspora]